jgi:hypothetical protein
VLHVIDPCVTATRAVAQPFWLDVEYDILAPEHTFTWSDAAVSVNETICGDWEYELLFNVNNTAIADAGTSIHVDYTAKSFQVYSEDHALTDTFTIVFTAWNTGYEAQLTYDTFDVDFINNCVED